MSRYDNPPPGAFYASPPQPPVEKKRSGLGAAALVLALLALLFGWIPVLGLAMLPAALLAAVLGVLGFIVAVVTGRAGKTLPFIASVVAVFAMLVPVASTVVFALSVTPYAYTIGMDQVQIELEHDLLKQGVEREQAERISSEIGDILRSFAKPSEWRDGISAAHRFGLACEGFRNELWALEEGDEAGQEAAAERFRNELSRLADRYGAELTDEDLALIADSIGREHLRDAGNWRHTRGYERGYRIQAGVIDSTSCPVGSCCCE